MVTPPEPPDQIPGESGAEPAVVPSSQPVYSPPGPPPVQPVYEPPSPPPVQPVYAPPSPPKTDRYVLAIISLVLGILNLCAWFVPFCGGPLAIVGIILGVLGLNSSRKGLAIAGIVLSGIALLLSIINAAFGAYLGLTGGFPFLNP